MNNIKTEFDRLLSRYGSPIKPPRQWKQPQPKLNTSIAKPAKTTLEKSPLNVITFREQK